VSPSLKRSSSMVVLVPTGILTPFIVPIFAGRGRRVPRRSGRLQGRLRRARGRPVGARDRRHFARRRRLRSAHLRQDRRARRLDPRHRAARGAARRLPSALVDGVERGSAMLGDSRRRAQRRCSLVGRRRGDTRPRGPGEAASSPPGFPRRWPGAPRGGAGPSDPLHPAEVPVMVRFPLFAPRSWLRPDSPPAGATWSSTAASEAPRSRCRPRTATRRGFAMPGRDHPPPPALRTRASCHARAPTCRCRR
jgi:hypothetical protein